MRALHGWENLLIAAVMAVFALLGSTYGFCEEAIPFYALPHTAANDGTPPLATPRLPRPRA